VSLSLPAAGVGSWRRSRRQLWSAWAEARRCCRGWRRNRPSPRCRVSRCHHS